jgi:putative phosphoesterase
MRIALLSDVHGNDVAFEAVVEDLDRIGVDGAVCLGDVAQGGPQPRDVLARLRALGCPVVLGNADEFLLELPTSGREPLTDEQLDVRAWTLERLDDDELMYVRSFEPRVDVPVDGASLLCFHGSPSSNEDVLLPSSAESDAEPFRDTRADLLAGGHTHLQWTRRVDAGVYVNPGSVGLAYDRHWAAGGHPTLTPVAEYAVVTGGRDPAVEFRRVPYSLDRLVAAIRASGRPHAERFISEWRAPASRPS